MSEWKQAWLLSKIELKSNIFWFIPRVLLFIFLAIILGSTFEAYMDEHIFFSEQNPGIFDLVFIAIFAMLPYLIQPKNFRHQQINGDLWASPYFIKLLHLSIPEKIIIKNRLLTYFFLSVPFHILFLICFYFSSRLNGEILSPITFLIFSIIWLSFGSYVGNSSPASDVGNQLSTLKRWLSYMLFGGIAISLFLFIQYHSPNGIVAWTVHCAERWPGLSSIFSIFLAIVGIRYWMYRMNVMIKRIDYL